MTFDSLAVGINMLPKPWRRGGCTWPGVLGNLLTSMCGPVAGAASGFINNVIWADLIRHFNRVCDYQPELGLLSEFAPMNFTVLVSATSICFCYCVPSFQLSFQHHSTRHLFQGGQTGIAWGDSLFTGRQSCTNGFGQVCVATRHSSSIVSCESGWCTSLR